MKNSRIIFFLVVILFSATQLFGQILPPEPAFPGASGGSVPLDGGLLLALLAAGGVGASLFAKSKKEDK